MDLSKLSIADQATLTLTHPADGTTLKDDSGKPMTITLVGADSNVYKSALFDIRRSQVKPDNEAAAYEEVDKSAIKLLARSTLGWHIQLNGDFPEFTVAAAEDLYTKVPWIKDQVDAFVHRRVHFLAR